MYWITLDCIIRVYEIILDLIVSDHILYRICIGSYQIVSDHVRFIGSYQYVLDHVRFIGSYQIRLDHIKWYRIVSDWIVIGVYRPTYFLLCICSFPH